MIGRSDNQDLYWMQQAFNLALQAQAQGEVPVGAVIVRDTTLISTGFNSPIATHDPTAHAEIQAIRAAAINDQNYRLKDATLYVTLEPCTMCAGAIIQSRIKRVVYGTRDPRAGAVHSVFNILQNNALNHRCEIHEGLLATECRQLLQDFFAAKRMTSL